MISAATSLNQGHLRKVNKYNTSEMRTALAREFKVTQDKVKVTSATVSWRGVWAISSARDLVGLGLAQILPGITTRALQGSSTNWNRWNAMTSMQNPEQTNRRTGIG